MESIYTDKDAARRKARIDALIEENERYTLDDFGGAPSKMVSTYEKPKAYPRNERPRVFLTGDMIPKIRATLEDPEYANLKKIFWESANTEYYTHTVLRGIPEHNPPKLELPKEYTEGGPHVFDGRFLSLDITGKSYNWDGKVIAIIEAKALAYLITGDELYAREAILYIKNAIKTLRFTTELFCDPFRAFSYTMLVVAEIYDWCHDLLSEHDKEQLVSGCEHILCAFDPENGVYNMTIGFPPSRQSGVSGHGVSVMLVRDYLAMSAAIFEDHPDWWEFCAGRFFEEFVAPADVAFRGGFVSQGTCCYCFNKFHTYLSGAWVVKNATGVMPFSDNMRNVMSSILGHLLPNGKMFPSGDGARSDEGVHRGSAYSCMAFSAGLFPDAAVSANMKYFSNEYTNTDYFVNELSETMMLILMSNAAKPVPDRFSAIPSVTYNPFPFGQMLSHNGWDEKGAATLMKIGEFTSANHDHRDAGTFQIYYKGLLLTSNGTYAKYWSNHHLFYHQDTISENGLLIYNPEKYDASANPHGAFNERQRYWYTGGQRFISEAGTMEKWLGGEYELGHVTGYASDALDGKSIPRYAYIAGDITKAYDTESTVDLVERRMLTVYTEDEKRPLLFFTYDKIVSKKPEFKKIYLLHPSAEPEIDGATVSFSKHGARLVFTMLKGAEKVEKIGGEGKAFLINGVNCDGPENGKMYGDMCDKIWGRVEFSADSGREHEFLGALFVSDDGAEAFAEARTFENDTVITAELLGTAAVFMKNSERAAGKISFESSADIEKYYVSGVAAGEWRVKVDGEHVANALATEESGFLAFGARGGKIVLEKIS